MCMDVICNSVQESCLISSLPSYSFTPLTIRSLKEVVHVKLLLNLCFALLGLYVTFIISTVSTGVPVLCGVVSALMHYFFLAVFYWMAAEAIHLHRKLVTVFKPDITSYVAIAMAICWGRLVHRPFSRGSRAMTSPARCKAKAVGDSIVIIRVVVVIV